MDAPVIYESFLLASAHLLQECMRTALACYHNVFRHLPKYCDMYMQHEEEPPHIVGKEGSSDQSEKLSKAAIKNKRKREAQQKTKDHEQVRVVHNGMHPIAWRFSL